MDPSATLVWLDSGASPPEGANSVSLAINLATSATQILVGVFAPYRQWAVLVRGVHQAHGTTTPTMAASAVAAMPKELCKDFVMNRPDSADVWTALKGKTATGVSRVSTTFQTAELATVM